MILAALALLLHSSWFHNYGLKKLQQEASIKLGTQVQLENFVVHLSHLSVDLYGLTIRGAPPRPKPPLLQVQHIGVGVRVVSILHRQWYLDRLSIDHPVVQVSTDIHGVSNIPHVTSSSGGGSTFNIFQLGVRHVIINGGVLYYDDKKSALDADLRDLVFHSRFDSSAQEYSCNLSYQDGHLRMGGFQPVTHELQAAFTASPDNFHLTHARLISGSSQLELTADLKNYQHPAVSATYEMTLDGNDLGRILRDPSIPMGSLHTAGSFSYHQDARLALLDVLAVDGQLNSRSLSYHTPKLHMQISDLSAHYSLDHGNASIEKMQARVLGGKLSAAATMHNLTGNTRSNVTASLRGLSLAEAQRLAPGSAATRDLRVRGVLNAEVRAAWGKTLSNLVVNTDAAVHGRVANTQGNGAAPLEGTVHGAYRAANNQIALAHSYLKMSQTSLALNGSLGNRASLAVQFECKDLREVETVATILRPSIAGSQAGALGLAGKAAFQGTIRGSTSHPHLTGRLVASDVHIRGSNFPVIESDIDLDPSHASLQHAKLEVSAGTSQVSSVGQSPKSLVGSIQFHGSAGLSHWGLEKTSPVELQFHAAHLDVATLERLAGIQAEVVGSLAADIRLHGTEENPIGHGRLSLRNAKALDEPIQSLDVAFNGNPDSIQGDLSAHAPAGSLHSVLTYHPVEKSYDVQLKADNLNLDKLQILQTHSIQAKGLLSLDASGQGTIENPGLTAMLKIPQLEIKNQKIADVHLDLNIANHNLMARLNSHAIDTSIEAHANISLSGDYMTEAALDTKPINFEPLLALYAPSVGTDFSGQTEIHATVKGPLKRKDLLTAHITLPELRMAYGKNVELAATDAIHADYSNGVISLQRTRIEGTDTNLQLQGSVPVYGNASVSVLLLGTVNLQLAQLFDSDVRSSGDLIFNINSYGARKDPNVEGEVAIVNANFSNGSLPVGVQHGNGVLTLTKDRLNIKSFQADVGGGKLTAQGGITYRPAIQFDLGAAAKNIRMLYPQGLREELSADLRLAGNEQNALLGGAVRVANVSFTPAFDLTSFIGEVSGGVAPPPTPGFSQNLHLNLAVSSTSGVSLVSRTLSLNGTANLQVRGTAAEPVILGRINLNDGDVIFNGNRFVLTGGTVAFVNPAQTEPVVNLTLNTTIQEYNIHLRFNGPVDQLRTNYASDPSLPSADIINLLAFGQTTEANAANPATPGNEAAEGLLASQVSSQITSRVSKIAGISQLSINPVLSGGSTQGPAGAIVTVQQRVTGNFFVTFSTNVATTQDQVIMGQYQLSPKVAVTGTRDQNGGFAFDTIFKKSW